MVLTDAGLRCLRVAGNNEGADEMKTSEAITIAITAVEVSHRAMPDLDVKAALRVLRTTRRGEIEKQEAAAISRLK